MVSDGMLSQDEIDALLRGGGDDISFDEPTNSDDQTTNIDDYLSPLEQDALGEIGNISFGSSATALSTLLNQKVDITTPKVFIVRKSQLAEAFPQPYVAVQVQYTAGFKGVNLLVIKKSDAAIIADLMLGGDGKNPSEDLGEIQLSAVQEAMNQMMGSAATSMSTIFSKKVDISPPSIDFLDFMKGSGTDRVPDEEVLVQISFNLKIGDLIDSNIMQLLQIDFAKDMVEGLLNPQPNNEPDLVNSNPASVMSAAPMEQPVTSVEQESNAPIFSAPMEERTMNMNYYQDPRQQQMPMGNFGQPMMPPFNGAMPSNPIQSGPQHIGTGPVNPTNVQPVVFSSFEQPTLQRQESSNLSMLLDIPLQVTVELGRTKRSVKEILDLSAGSIIELDKLAGEPVDILINNKLVAKGEVVVIEENFGVRVTDIISQSDRIKNLQ
ncbi:flagellar motor switch protein FliN [Schinkia azotoformans MEV2011]|uniref:Flagellar motor switch protein FliN n=1 Tax=Schinkia azotoformans MEV2011 TaxID=1348973 RepID=A0A072NRM3_SCHAZ|nr:flagellar motor switch phosphatase FliY [Schinkia azotoformans]KEF39887.1 flagellar motor switch protein FliN [Schinkia azotoformans MEV2011]MEC1697186.1 flagellar motor switch phosphatase FliY [Schinkia azotoformans]MEC1715281.1 flagellar motor switch phosphatase FliY [Schinkia azotoformans]MEC1724225.1 flagellar motor switch phosphatase FliY [Schinkia azotoformans]MEC1740968.1 flagellar motor switch phosphatase FliY [Schinkia azotoformans]